MSDGYPLTFFQEDPVSLTALRPEWSLPGSDPMADLRAAFNAYVDADYREWCRVREGLVRQALETTSWTFWHRLHHVDQAGCGPAVACSITGRP